MLAPPLAAFGPDDQMTAGVDDTSVTALPQVEPGLTPLPLSQT
jgi:hypothetical protein